MKNYYTSFINEHTAEYILISKLTNILKQKFKVVIPIFPWLNREGSIISKTIHRHDKFKIVGLYPRRPKINLLDPNIYVKINQEILEGAHHASNYNIPMIAGCPLSRNFWELTESAQCIWIKLTDNTKYLYNVEFIDRINEKYKILQNEEILNNSTDILNFIVKNSKSINFEIFLEAIRAIRSQGYVRSMWFGIYKPIYFLLKEQIK